MKTIIIPSGTTSRLIIDALLEPLRIIVEHSASLQLHYRITGTCEHELEIVLQQLASCEHEIVFDNPLSASLSFTYTLYKQSMLKVYSKTRLHNNSSVYLTTQQRHIEPESQSDVLCKVVVSEQAHWNYTGTIYIAPHAQGTVAQQMNPCLIDGSGTVKSMPIIEVLAHEVSCKHGAASGKLDEEALQYLGMRGITQQDARQLIIEAFLQ